MAVEVTLPFEVPYTSEIYYYTDGDGNEQSSTSYDEDLSSMNTSMEPGDIAYYIRSVPGGSGGFDTHAMGEKIVKIGKIKSAGWVGGVTRKFIVTCITDLSVDEYPVGQSDCSESGCNNKGDFIFFVKDRGVEEASLVGYYGEFKFTNNSRQKAELFATSCEVSESSK
jgi:hypothetical protein